MCAALLLAMGLLLGKKLHLHKSVTIAVMFRLLSMAMQTQTQSNNGDGICEVCGEKILAIIGSDHIDFSCGCGSWAEEIKDANQ